MKAREKSVRMTATDFFSGLFATFAVKGHQTILLNKDFEERVERLFQQLADYAEENGIDLRFRIRLHWFHGDSETIHQGIFTAMQIGLITLDSPGNQTARIKITKERAKVILDNVSGKSFFEDSSEKITEVFSS